MGVVARALMVSAATAVFAGACLGGNMGHLTGAGTSAPVNPVAATDASATRADYRGDSERDEAALPPDVAGNPACPVSDSWGRAPIDNGIFVTYWANGADYVTVLVRTSSGADYARSTTIGPDQPLRIFDFPAVDAATVDQVLIITNVKRCFATPDPATSGR